MYTELGLVLKEGEHSSICSIWEITGVSRIRGWDPLARRLLA